MADSKDMERARDLNMSDHQRITEWLEDHEPTVNDVLALETLEEAAKLGHKVAFEFLGMHREQRAYSWHDVEDALTKGSEAIRNLAKGE